MDNTVSVSDLVVSAYEQKPLDFETAFNDLIVDRIRNAVEQKKIEIAQQMYNYTPEPAVETEGQENAEES